MLGVLPQCIVMLHLLQWCLTDITSCRTKSVASKCCLECGLNMFQGRAPVVTLNLSEP